MFEVERANGTPAPRRSLRLQCAFTLIELVVVVAIIAVLMALLLPVLSRMKVHSQVRRANSEIAQLAVALKDYEATYNRFPVSSAALNSVASAQEDLTYGGLFKMDAGGIQWVAGPGNYLTNNAEIMAVLLDLECFGNGQPTLNTNHVRNWKMIRFLKPALANDTVSPGVGLDGVYRDPWGSPYLVTFDFNNDGFARDDFYREPSVSADPANTNRGLNGLVRRTDARGKPVFEARDRVIVWSAGPDRRINRETNALAGDNKDNLVSWK